MSKLNDVIGNTGIPVDVQNEFSKCLFCFKEITEGGSWAGNYNIGVCVNCCDHLIDLLIDTLEDADAEYKNLSSEEQLEKLAKITKERFLKKESDSIKIKATKATRSMQKLGLKYYSEIGIIDFFELTMSSDELKRKVDSRNNEMIGCSFDMDDVDICIEKIKEIIYSETHENPHTVRFFSIPNFDYGSFDIGCVAKIDNNGSTYIFANDSKFIENYQSYNDIKLAF